MSFSPEVKSEVAHRSQGNCETRLDGCAGQASDFHHRLLRRWGDHTTANALHVCSPCHQTIHTIGEPAYRHGWLVHAWDDPATIPVRS